MSVPKILAVWLQTRNIQDRITVIQVTLQRNHTQLRGPEGIAWQMIKARLKELLNHVHMQRKSGRLIHPHCTRGIYLSMKPGGPEAVLVKEFPYIFPREAIVSRLQHVDALNQEPQGMRNRNLIAQSLPFQSQVVSQPNATPSSMDEGHLKRMPT